MAGAPQHVSTRTTKHGDICCRYFSSIPSTLLVALTAPMAFKSNGRLSMDRWLSAPATPEDLGSQDVGMSKLPFEYDLQHLIDLQIIAKGGNGCLRPRHVPPPPISDHPDCMGRPGHVYAFVPRSDGHADQAWKAGYPNLENLAVSQDQYINALRRTCPDTLAGAECTTVVSCMRAEPSTYFACRFLRPGEVARAGQHLAHSFRCH